MHAYIFVGVASISASARHFAVWNVLYTYTQGNEMSYSFSIDLCILKAIIHFTNEFRLQVNRILMVRSQKKPCEKLEESWKQNAAINFGLFLLELCIVAALPLTSLSLTSLLSLHSASLCLARSLLSLAVLAPAHSPDRRLVSAAIAFNIKMLFIRL